MGRGCPPPQPTRGSAERRELPQRGPGGAPTENGFGALYSCQKAPRSNHFEYFKVHVVH